jgi:hypothetical protein
MKRIHNFFSCSKYGIQTIFVCMCWWVTWMWRHKNTESGISDQKEWHWFNDNGKCFDKFCGARKTVVAAISKQNDPLHKCIGFKTNLHLRRFDVNLRDQHVFCMPQSIYPPSFSHMKRIEQYRKVSTLINQCFLLPCIR